MKEGIYSLMGFLLTLLAIPLIKKFSLAVGYLDRPGDNALKIHSLAIPLSGGIAFLGIFSLLFLALLLTGEVADRSRLLGLMIGGLIVSAFGILDDLKQVPAVSRLGAEVLAGMMLLFFGQGIAAPFGLGIFLTLFYVVGAINAINMEDGLDGLAGGMAFLSFFGFAFLAFQAGWSTELLISSVMIGVLIGFLFYNFSPSSIFMGDGGSYFLGFILAYLAIRFTGLDSWTKFLGPILIIGAPVFDTAYAILRRLKNRASLFTGDRNHFYDQLMRKGFTTRQTVLICWGIQFIFVSLGIWIITF